MGGADAKVGRSLHAPETYIVLSGALALVLLGLSGLGLAMPPLEVFLSTMLLFMVPGIVVLRRFFAEHISGIVMVPVSFTISIGIFALPGLPFLVLHGNLGPYLWISGAIVVASLAVAVLGIAYQKPIVENGSSPSRSSFAWLWVPFVLLGAALAYVSRFRAAGTMGDV